MPGPGEEDTGEHAAVAAAPAPAPKRRAPAPPAPAPVPVPHDRGDRSDRKDRKDRKAERRGLRYRVLPRTLLGITAFILAFAIGAGLSGVVLYSYYQYRLDQTNTRVDTVVNGYKKQFANAEGDLAQAAAQAKSQIQAQLAPIESLAGDPAAQAALVKKLAPSLFYVRTLDANGEASVGTAFVISSNTTQSLLLTSYTTVAAATRSPGPTVYLQQGTTTTPVTVKTWDASNDLALIVLPRGNLPVLAAAPASPGPAIGERVYAISGLGTAGASISEGAISDVSASGLADTAPVGPQFQGGPIVNSSGQIVAVASRTFAPLGFTPAGVFYGPYLQAACSKVLACPNGSFSAAS
jgi:S1-C subfamily serine protease